MKAVVLERFGGPEQLVLQNVPVPKINAHEVLVQVEYAGIGEWDSFEREGGYAEMLGIPPRFPYILGSEGAGMIVEVGKDVRELKVGDSVYGPAFLNPSGGFYAEYAAIDSKVVAMIPDNISWPEASVISGVGLTALRGLEDVLQLKRGESIIIFGASGGVGHLAIQLAKEMGAKVFAVASGADGVALAEELGADAAIDGHKDEISLSARAFAPEGFDTGLLTAGGEAAERTVECVRTGGRVAYPFGVFPEPSGRTDKTITGFYGEPDAEIISRLQRYIASDHVHAHIQQSFPLEQAQAAHVALAQHYLGKLCLKVTDQ